MSLLAAPRREAHQYAKDTIPAEAGKGRIPGYSGYIPGSQHLGGTSFGKLTRLTEQNKKTGVNKPEMYFPPAPTRTSNQATQATGYRLPGYTGFVPGKR